MVVRIVAVLALTLALGLPASAGADLPSGNLLRNSGAEDGQAASDSGSFFTPPSWTAVGPAPSPTAVRYGIAGGFPSAAQGAALGGGANFFAGGPPVAGNVEQHWILRQTISIGDDALGDIAGGDTVATMAGCLGGYGDQDDHVLMTVYFVGATNQVLDQRTLSGPIARDRGNRTGLLPEAARNGVPPDTRSIRFDVDFVRNSGLDTYNDAYADNLGLTLTPAASPTPGANCSAPAGGGGSGGPPGDGGSPPAAPFVVERASSKAALSSGRSKIGVPLTCAGHDGQCVGSIVLALPSSSRASSSTLGKRSFSIAAGKTSVVQVKLGRSAKKRLKRLSRTGLRKLRLKATVSIRGTSSSFSLRLGV
ncbi:MAG TPA: hypothetical protein VN606_12050 [Thermoleophilaceae bacterium]|nr:hypothetical protein [Thermoleophilaceae bacterium]